MEVSDLGGGLWRWTTPHPEWTPDKDKPGGWGRDVASTYVEVPGADTLVLIDPQVPREGSREAERWRWRGGYARYCGRPPDWPCIRVSGNGVGESPSSRR